MSKLLISLLICSFALSGYAQEQSGSGTKESLASGTSAAIMHEDKDGEIAADEYQIISVNGGVTRRPCPYTCEMRGIPRDHCKEWTSNNKVDCYVQDTSKPADVMP